MRKLFLLVLLAATVAAADKPASTVPAPLKAEDQAMLWKSLAELRSVEAEFSQLQTQLVQAQAAAQDAQSKMNDVRAKYPAMAQKLKDTEKALAKEYHAGGYVLLDPALRPLDAQLQWKAAPAAGPEKK